MGSASSFGLVVQVWQTLSAFNAGNFIDAYILLPLFPAVYFGFKIWKKTRYWKLGEIDLDSGRRKDLDKAAKEVIGGFSRDNDEDDVDAGANKSLWKRIWSSLSSTTITTRHHRL